MIKQKNLINFLKITSNQTPIYLIIQISHHKLLKLLIQQFLFFITDLKYFTLKKKLILITYNLGSIFKILSFFQFSSLNSAIFKSKSKKKHVLNRLGFFKVDLTEEKNLLKEETKPKVYKRGGKKFKFKRIESPTFYMQPYIRNFITKRVRFKNYLQIKNILPLNNSLNNKFFTNLFFNYFRNYKIIFKNNFSFLQLKNFNFFFLILNFININIKLRYFFFCQCPLFIK